MTAVEQSFAPAIDTLQHLQDETETSLTDPVSDSVLPEHHHHERDWVTLDEHTASGVLAEVEHIDFGVPSKTHTHPHHHHHGQDLSTLTHPSILNDPDHAHDIAIRFLGLGSKVADVSYNSSAHAHSDERHRPPIRPLSQRDDFASDPGWLGS